MNIRAFGRFGTVSALSLGGGGVGGVYGAVDREEARATVRAAVDAGITMLDLAPIYGPGEASPQAELVVGEAFARRLPEHVRVTSKVVIEDPAPPEVIRSTMRASLQATLDRLGRDHLDVYILHSYVRPAGTAPLAGTVAVDVASEVVLPEFERLVAEGAIGAWGLTGTAVPAEVCALLEHDPAPGAVQCVTNALDALGNMWPDGLPGRPDNDRILDAAVAHDVAVMGVRALAAGALSDHLDRTLPESDPYLQDYRRADAFRALAHECGVAPATLAHRYAVSLPGVATVVIGAKDRRELAQCVAAEAAPALSPDEMARIRETRGG
jgi:aryl-alcohol dehydrogenase-like predicted oxidoreductase